MTLWLASEALETESGFDTERKPSNFVLRCQIMTHNLHTSSDGSRNVVTQYDTTAMPNSINFARRLGSYLIPTKNLIARRVPTTDLSQQNSTTHEGCDTRPDNFFESSVCVAPTLI